MLRRVMFLSLIPPNSPIINTSPQPTTEINMNKFKKAVSIFHATPEKQKQLEDLHGIKLEDAPFKPTSKEIVKAYLDKGDKGVCCWVSESNEQPGFFSSWVFIKQVVDSEYPFVDSDGWNWKHATPFDHTTLQPITELPKGDAKAV